MNWSVKVLLLGVTLATSACAAATMTVPADVASMDAENIKATERKKASGALVNESFKLLPYEVVDVDRDWKKTSTLSIGGHSGGKSVSGYSYTFKGAADTNGTCKVEGEKQGLELGSGFSASQSESKLTCNCTFEGNVVESVMNSKNDGKYDGKVTTSEGEFTITAISNSSKRKAAGYRIDGDAVMAAVEVYHPGQIWLSNELSKEMKEQLSCIFAGLLLYKP